MMLGFDVVWHDWYALNIIRHVHKQINGLYFTYGLLLIEISLLLNER